MRHGWGLTLMKMQKLSKAGVFFYWKSQNKVWFGSYNYKNAKISCS